MQPGATVVPPPMTAPAADNQQNHFQYQQPQPWQQLQQPWMNHHHQQQQQWMNQQPPHPSFQYHPQQAVYYHQQLPPQPPAAQPTNPDEVRSLWIGDLPTWLDEQFIIGCFGITGEVVAAKVIRNKQTGQSEGYGFIECVNHAAAERILQTYNGTPIPNAGQNFRLNWAHSGSSEKRSDGTPDFTVFVGDLSPDVTDDVLLETFSAHYTSIKSAKVVMDRLTGRAKGYGFIRFADENEQLRAMSEMNGQLCLTRPMRVGAALNKKNEGAVPYQTSQGAQNEDDPTNTTIFVGGLNESISDDQLRHVFSPYGQLIHVKIPAGKRCGFVQFAERNSAEEALKMLNGTQLSGQSIRLSWGRSPNKQAQVDQSQWNGGGGGYYGYAAPGYDSYGYSAPPQQDPNLYYGGGAYSGYGNFPQQHQQ
ncbi:polyadenylate-binding protein RBP45-like [Impatiens glandulifera]|uniref:polyadenylate-binding protein RBP45-like n=1 Tax=Impatiens glandulifera TaxID=253017 RepID=UPI001FB10050|nr:polyadenylate-binding protein RBP45-like [Impatiens glandulifera]